MNPPGFRLPASSSAFTCTPPRSVPKSRSDETGLRLTRVIGTTTSTSHGFDCVPKARQFAYTAGAAAVVCSVNDGLDVTQRFFRARPSGGVKDGLHSLSLSPTPNEARSRVVGHTRDAAGSPCISNDRGWLDSPSGKSTTARDKVKAATAVALSPNGKWLAVGETGYRPRVLIFAQHRGESEPPVCVRAEHTFGVHALRFSPDSRHLASLGTTHDGFLYLWSVDDRTGALSLHASNKCTVVIHVMAWVGGTLFTVGLRVIKAWKVDDESTEESASTPGTLRRNEFANSVSRSRQRVFRGKNCLLGDLLDANFVTLVPITDDKAIACADTGEVCLLSDASRTVNLTNVATTEFRVTAARLDDHDGLCVMGPGDASQRFELSTLERSSPRTPKRDRRLTSSPSKSLSLDILAPSVAAALDGVTVKIDSKRSITLTDSTQPTADGLAAKSHRLPAHHDAVLGVQGVACDAFPDASYVTFSGDGAVKLWSFDGSAIVASVNVPMGDAATIPDSCNEIRSAAVMVANQDLYVVTGDRIGIVSVVNIRTGQLTAPVRGHSTEVTAVAAFESLGLQLVATASRDRTVQLFAWTEERLDLLQTMDEHAAAVTGLLPMSAGRLLLSCSSDRSIVVREAVHRDSDPRSLAYVMLRAITLRSSPTAMCVGPTDEEILVATLDRSIAQHHVRNGRAGPHFKCSDTDGGEAAAISRILYEIALNGNPTIVAVSSGDKSVRLYTEYGSLIARDWGHTEGITDVAVVRARDDAAGQTGSARLITVAGDSTIFVWDTVPAPASPGKQGGEIAGGLDQATPTKPPSAVPPLRKVLSHSELSRRRDPNRDPPSPSVSRPTSPQRLQRKTSRMSVAQPPRLEPALRSTDRDRRASLRKRSPSPPSPRAQPFPNRAQRGPTSSSQSSESVSFSAPTAVPSPTQSTTAAPGSLHACAETTCRSLRALRRKLACAKTNEDATADVLSELKTELELTAKVVGERSHDRELDETTMARLLEQVSEKIVDRLDERIRERVDGRFGGHGASFIAASSGPKAGLSETIDEDGAVDEDKVVARMMEVKLGS